MSNFEISIIIPVFNASLSLSKCIQSIKSQTFSEPFETIFVDDRSTDNSFELIKREKLKNSSFFQLKKNFGPAYARNYALSKASGKYVFFLDADDELEANVLFLLHEKAKEKNYDLVFSDKKRVENKINQNENNYFFKLDRSFNKKEILEEIKNRFYDPLYIGGLIGITGRLVKRSVLVENNLRFVDSLRFLEDDTFSYDLLSSINSAYYIKKQLYTYNILPNIETGISIGIMYNLSIENYKLVKNHIENSIHKLGGRKNEIKIIGNQALIYLLIKTLISFSRSLILGKIDYKKGLEIRKNFISNIIEDKEIYKIIQNYKASKDESYLIPKAIMWRSKFLLSISSMMRAKKILKMRRKNLIKK
jgi:glycosyltransferase involved in cell wall biosynthesis